MLSDQFKNQSSIQCFLHKRQKATHICTDLRCHNNPIMCQLCFDQNNHKNLHGSHESFIQTIGDAVDRIGNIIKNQSSQIQKIYNHTVGAKEYDQIMKNIQKGELLYQEVQNRIKRVKQQIELELEVLLKQIQKKILIEKEECFKHLDNYQKTYIENFQHLKMQSQYLIQFQKGLKYYSNPNNLYLKITYQTKKKSLQWLIQNKRTLHSTTKILENIHYISQTNRILQLMNSMNIERLPVWVATELSDDKGRQFGLWIKKILEGWIKMPQLRLIEKNTDKYLTYFMQSR